MLGETKPCNLLFIMADQHRHDYVGAPFSGSATVTPVLDHFRDLGAQFEQERSCHMTTKSIALFACLPLVLAEAARIVADSIESHSQATFLTFHSCLLHFTGYHLRASLRAIESEFADRGIGRSKQDHLRCRLGSCTFLQNVHSGDHLETIVRV